MIKYIYIKFDVEDYSWTLTSNLNLTQQPTHRLKSFDREVRANYTCKLKVTDLATPPSARLTASAQLDLLISDVNDNPPSFTFTRGQGSANFRFALLENQQINSRVGVVCIAIVLLCNILHTFVYAIVTQPIYSTNGLYMYICIGL